jgi:hypothetical protein
MKVHISEVLIEWVFNMSFDSYEENYVTLNNRNFTRLILG